MESLYRTPNITSHPITSLLVDCTKADANTMGIGWTLVEPCKKVHTKQPEITVKFTGYDLGKVEQCWIVAVNRFFAPGGGAEQV